MEFELAYNVSLEVETIVGLEFTLTYKFYLVPFDQIVSKLTEYKNKGKKFRKLVDGFFELFEKQDKFMRNQQIPINAEIVSNIYNNFGVIYLELNNFEKSEELFKRALSFIDSS